MIIMDSLSLAPVGIVDELTLSGHWQTSTVRKIDYTHSFIIMYYYLVGRYHSKMVLFFSAKQLILSIELCNSSV